MKPLTSLRNTVIIWKQGTEFVILSTNLTGSFILGLNMSTAINRLYEVNAKTYGIVLCLSNLGHGEWQGMYYFFLMESLWVHVSVLSPCNLWWAPWWHLQKICLFLEIYIPLVTEEARFWDHSEIQAQFTTRCLSSNDQMVLFKFLESFVIVE